jgi:ketosteroid isomerase-like protein
MSSEEIARQVRELADRAAILDVVIAYATALDTRDWEALAGLFTEDARWEYRASGEQVHGAQAIAARIRPALEHLDATQHFNGNHVIAVHGDEAEHTCYYHAQHVRRGLPDGELYLGAGRYEDHLHRTPAGWRLTDRVLISIWGEGNPAVLRR